MAEKERKKGWEAANAKWTYKTGQHGYLILPIILFRCAYDLGLKPAQQAVLFQLLSYWWEADRPPVVSKAELAERLGITKRQVQRNLRALEKLELISSKFQNRPGRHPNEYTFDGLVNKLQKKAVAYRRAKKQQEYERSQATKSTAKAK